MRKQTTAPFNINFTTIFDNDAQIPICAEERVPIVSFHWGRPSTEHIKLVRDAGVSIWEQIGSVDAARTVLGDGIEVVVAQGWEAGGHNYGGLPTMALVPTVVDAAHRKREVRCHAGENHAYTGKRMLAAKALGEPRDDVAHVVPL